MKNSIDITRKYQFGYMLTRHFVAAMICFVFEAVAFYGFLVSPVAKYVVSGIFTLVYAGVLYSSAAKLAGFDGKPYTPLKPELQWGVLWGLMISVMTAVFMVIFKINWRIIGDGTASLLSVIINLIFYICAAPYFGFLNNGNIPLFAEIIMLAVPVAACTAGYLAGARNFDLVSKLDSMTFEKDEDDE